MRIMRRAGRGWLLASVAATISLAAACTSGEAVPGNATGEGNGTTQESTGQAPPSSAPAAAEDDEPPPPPLLLIMDYSGSMAERDTNGTVLIDGAKQALHDLVEALPEGQQVGLRVYGHRVPDTDRQNGCQDTELVHPVAPLDRAALNSAIDRFNPTGFTPIARSLQAAAEDLPDEGPRMIVLVSDGEETCAPPQPCDVARQLAEDGVDLVVNTVGFALGDNDAARQQLTCIAEAGGGEFVDVSTAEELGEALGESTRDPRRYETAGTELVGTPIPRDAETGEVNTQHTDTVLGEEINFYRFEIPEGSTVRAELIVPGHPTANLRPFCPRAYLTDQGDRDLSGASLFQGGPTTETFISQTEEITVQDTEVWIKVDTGTCNDIEVPGLSELEFPIEFQLTVL